LGHLRAMEASLGMNPSHNRCNEALRRRQCSMPVRCRCQGPGLTVMVSAPADLALLHAQTAAAATFDSMLKLLLLLLLRGLPVLLMWLFQ
jgi:hypothetical protein